MDESLRDEEIVSQEFSTFLQKINLKFCVCSAILNVLREEKETNQFISSPFIRPQIFLNSQKIGACFICFIPIFFITS